MRQRKCSDSPQKRKGNCGLDAVWYEPVCVGLHQWFNGICIRQPRTGHAHNKQQYHRDRHNDSLDYHSGCHTLDSSGDRRNDNQHCKDSQTNSIIRSGQDLENTAASGNGRNCKGSQEKQGHKSAQPSYYFAVVITVHQKFNKCIGIGSSRHDSYSFSNKTKHHEVRPNGEEAAYHPDGTKGVGKSRNTHEHAGSCHTCRNHHGCN